MQSYMDTRQQALQTWLSEQLKYDFEISPLAGDASFRRYFRIIHNGRSLVAMDAPPDRENSHPFVSVAQAFEGQGVIVPDIIAKDLNQGFLLLSDFGDRLYLNCLNEQTANELYRKAFQSLLKIQACKTFSEHQLPTFDGSFIASELNNFYEWYLQKHVNLEITPTVKRLLDYSFKFLSENITSIPSTCVHRDYHSRNLMLLQNGKMGVLDFQDAVWGPVTYDAVSLLRDCYIKWPEQKVQQWLTEYYQLAIDANTIQPVSFEQFSRWFDLAGLQRHLKAIGIFARLNHRDNKSDYLKDIPRVMEYVAEVCQHYPELHDFHSFISNDLELP